MRANPAAVQFILAPAAARRRSFPKGRVLRQEEAATVKALLGERRGRALLIEYLHRIQDR